MASLEKPIKSDENLQRRAELAVLADQFVDEGRLSASQAREIALIKDSDEAHKRFLELVEARHEEERLNVVDNSGYSRKGSVDDRLA